jgi:ParB family chromosome partitioning protein
MTTTAATQAIGQMVPLSLLIPSPLNPRKRFDDVHLGELQANIQKRGEVIVPLILRSKDAQTHEIVDGERRWRAATAAGNVDQVPAIFRNDLTDGEVIEIQLLSALQRQELTPLEEASGYKALIESNPAKYSAAYIGDRIGRSEKYVHDRMRLLKLVPVIKKLLEAERILVGHAELLCRLKAEDQERALEPPSRFGVNGLWQSEHGRLHLDEDADAEPTAKNLYRGLKPVTVKELESWIAHHVRLDVEHAAAVAPLDFGPVAEQVEAAKAQPGRGRKVISITHDYRVADDARDATERTYGSQSWHRADGKKGSKTCEHAVLGVFVAGPGYGTTLQVCVNRDRCQVHFAKEIKAREKNAKLRATGKGGKATQNEVSAAAKRKAEEDERERKRKAWDALAPHIIADAVAQVKGVKTLTAGQAKFIFEEAIQDFYFQTVQTIKKHLGATWHTHVAAALLVACVDEDRQYDGFDEYVTEVAKPLGLDIKRLTAMRDKHQPPPAGEAKATKPAKATKKTAAKKGKATA